MFIKYQHVERLSTDEVEGINIGECHVQPKIDGTSGSVWLEDSELKCASRRRELIEGLDNAGFKEYIMKQDNVKGFFEKYSELRLFGEFLCLSGDTVIRKAGGGKRGMTMTLREMYKYSITPVQEKAYYKTKKENKICFSERPPWWVRYGYPSLFSLYQNEDKVKPNKMKGIFYVGDKKVYKIVTRKGYKIKGSKDHPFFTSNGFVKLNDLKVNDCVAVINFGVPKQMRTYGKGTNKIFLAQRKYIKEVGECERCGLKTCLELHHRDRNYKNNNKNNFIVLCKECHKKQHKNDKKFKGAKYEYEFDKIISIEYIGVEDCYDISMCGDENESNFIANGFIVHNCSHSLKTYRDDAWGKFYVFDVCRIVDEELVYIPYEEYKEMLDEFDLDYIPVLKTMVNAEEEDFVKILEQNTFLIKDGEGVGEGIVIKNYSYKNKFGRITWAKIVTSEFKEKHVKEFRGPKTEFKMIEQTIVDKFLTEAFIDKEFEKLKIEKDGWRSKYIPEFLGRVWYEFVNEECWNFVKKMKNPKINFKTLNAFVVLRVKEHRKDLF